MPTSTRKIVPPPDTKTRAGRVANLLHSAANRLKQRATKEAREAEIAQLVADGADAMAIVTRVAARHWSVLTMHMLGMKTREIAVAIGVKNHGSVAAILKRPEIVYLRDALRAAQKEKIIAGEFGAQAAFVAAAPKVAANVIEKAGAGPEGKKAAAEKDADMLRASSMVLKGAEVITGANRQAESHLMAILRDLSPEELDALKRQKKYPDRYVPVLRQLGFLKDAPA